MKAKIDTGARTSAIHVAQMEELGDGRIRFEVVIRERPQRRTVWVDAPLLRSASVRPSSGEVQQRPVVSALMKLGPVRRRIELGLVCREGMLCRMLVGRRALSDRFLVDPSRKYVLTRLRRRLGGSGVGRDGAGETRTDPGGGGR